MCSRGGGDEELPLSRGESLKAEHDSAPFKKAKKTKWKWSSNSPLIVTSAFVLLPLFKRVFSKALGVNRLIIFFTAVEQRFCFCISLGDEAGSMGFQGTHVAHPSMPHSHNLLSSPNPTASLEMQQQQEEAAQFSWGLGLGLAFGFGLQLGLALAQHV